MHICCYVGQTLGNFQGVKNNFRYKWSTEMSTSNILSYLVR